MILTKKKRIFIKSLLKVKTIKYFYFTQAVYSYFFSSLAVNNSTKNYITILLKNKKLLLHDKNCLLTGHRKSIIKEINISRQSLNRKLIFCEIDNIYVSS